MQAALVTCISMNSLVNRKEKEKQKERKKGKERETEGEGERVSHTGRGFWQRHSQKRRKP